MGTRESLIVRAAVATLFFTIGAAASAQSPLPLGSLKGRVTLEDAGSKSFRVKAFDTTNRIYYTTFTNSGSYNFASLPAGEYQVQVLDSGVESPSIGVRVVADETATADVKLKSTPASRRRTQYVTFDELYPPGPERDTLFNNCGGCHGRLFFHRRPKDESGWRSGVESMVSLDIPTSPSTAGNPVRPHLSRDDREAIIRYLVKNFPEGGARRDLKIDDPIVSPPVAARAAFVEFELPPITGKEPFKEVLKDNACTQCHEVKLKRPPVDPSAKSISRPGMVEFALTHAPRRMLITPSVGRDQKIWLADIGNNSLLRLDPSLLDSAKRWQEFPVPTQEYVFLHGTAVDSKGRVYWTEMHGDRLGELDPASGRSVRHKVPIVGGAISVAVDAKDNVWYGVSNGMAIGMLDAKTRKVSSWTTPDLDSNPYGLIVSRSGGVWYTDLNNDQLVMFDPKSEKFTKHAMPRRPWGPRRLAEDSNGKIWFSGHMVDVLASLDPKSGKLEQFPFPQSLTTVFEVVVAANDDVWVSDPGHNTLIKFDQRTKTFATYPLPQFHYYGPPKMEFDAQGTLWFGSRDTENITAVAFREDGNVKKILRQGASREALK